MQISWTKLLAMLTLCSATTLGACATDNASDDSDASSDDAASTTHITDPRTGEGQFLITLSGGISINLSVRQWQTDVNAWIQHFPLENCGPALVVDGGFGSKTTAATVCIQRANGLQANGDVGPITLGAMCADLTTAGEITLRDNTHCTQ